MGARRVNGRQHAMAAGAAITALVRPWFAPGAFVETAEIAERPIREAERPLVAKAVAKRQREFATGRWLARRGLRALGHPEQTIGIGRLRNPLWPEGVAGTITHDGGWCTVVLQLAPPGRPVGIGLDMITVSERQGKMADIAGMFVANPEELTACARFGLPVEPEMVCFALKEAAIKALVGRFADFVDMREIVLRPGPLVTVELSGTPVPMTLSAGIAGDQLMAGAVLAVENEGPPD